MTALERIEKIQKYLKRQSKLLAPDSPTNGEYQFLLGVIDAARVISWDGMDTFEGHSIKFWREIDIEMKDKIRRLERLKKEEPKA